MIFEHLGLTVLSSTAGLEEFAKLLLELCMSCINLNVFCVLFSSLRTLQVL